MYLIILYVNFDNKFYFGILWNCFFGFEFRENILYLKFCFK